MIISMILIYFVLQLNKLLELLLVRHPLRRYGRKTKRVKQNKTLMTTSYSMASICWPDYLQHITLVSTAHQIIFICNLVSQCSVFYRAYQMHVHPKRWVWIFKSINFFVFGRHRQVTIYLRNNNFAHFLWQLPT